jgi:uncharacterized membrane protein YhaH (DUF805 family)
MAVPQTPAVNPYAAPRAAVDDAAAETQPVRIFSVSGRIGRARYVVNLIGWNILFGALVGGLTALAGPAVIALWAGYVILAFMLTIQRCHDFNTTGWLSILALVPLLNLLFCFIPGTQGSNRFGAATPPNGAFTLIIAWLLPAIFVIGMVAAIALPAYQDYVKRAQQAGQRR